MNANSVIFNILKWLFENNHLVKPLKNSRNSDLLTLSLLHLPMNFTKEKRAKVVRWIKPRPGYYKLNVDGSALGNPGMAGCGGHARNEDGDLVVGFSSFLGTHSNIFAEIMALFSGLKLCHSLDIENVHIESDSEVIVNWLLNKKLPPIQYRNIWEDMVELVDRIGIDIKHVYREGNGVADILAKAGANGVNKSYMLSSELPDAARSLLQLDKEQLSSLRIR